MKATVEISAQVNIDNIIILVTKSLHNLNYNISQDKKF